MRSNRVLVLGLMMLAFSSRGAAKEYLNAKLKAGEVRYTKVLILPATVEITQQGVKGAEGMGKESEEASTALGANASAALVKCGLVVEAPFTEEAMKDQDELKMAVADVQRRLDQITAQLNRKKKDIEKGRFSLGDSVATVNQKGADALLIVRARGTKQTKGRSFLTGGLVGLAFSGTVTYSLRMVVLDAKTGEVMFLSDQFSNGIPEEKALGKALKKLAVTK